MSVHIVIIDGAWRVSRLHKIVQNHHCIPYMVLSHLRLYTVISYCHVENCRRYVPVPFILLYVACNIFWSMWKLAKFGIKSISQFKKSKQHQTTKRKKTTLKPLPWHAPHQSLADSSVCEPQCAITPNVEWVLYHPNATKRPPVHHRLVLPSRSIPQMALRRVYFSNLRRSHPWYHRTHP